jgi:hypothetical protein
MSHFYDQGMCIIIFSRLPIALKLGCVYSSPGLLLWNACILGGRNNVSSLDYSGKPVQGDRPGQKVT